MPALSTAGATRQLDMVAIDMKIERVEVFGVQIPLVGNFASGKGAKTAQKSAVVRVTANDGTIGLGSVEPIPSPQAAESVEDLLKLLRSRIAPAMIGVDPTNINKLRLVLERSVPGDTAAKVPVEMACVDLAARRGGVPVHTYLGGAVKDRLEFNAWIGLLTPDAAAAEALRWKKLGFRSAKIKVGSGIDADCDRIAAVRAAVGSEVALRIDANESYDALTSIRLAKAVKKFDLQHFEQPARRDDLDGLARVRREGGIPVMADESVTDLASLLAVIKAEAADTVKLGIKEQGGFHRAIQLLATAEAAGIPCVIGHGFGLDISTLAEITLGAVSHNVVTGLECVGPLKMVDSITTSRLDISLGALSLPSGPGLGVFLDDEKLEKYRLKTC